MIFKTRKANIAFWTIMCAIAFLYTMGKATGLVEPLTLKVFDPTTTIKTKTESGWEVAAKLKNEHPEVFQETIERAVKCTTVYSNALYQAHIANIVRGTDHYGFEEEVVNPGEDCYQHYLEGKRDAAEAWVRVLNNS